MDDINLLLDSVSSSSPSHSIETVPCVALSSSSLDSVEDERATHGTVSIECDGDEADAVSKRRLVSSIR